ncbi:MAG TPA: hypothetical protein VJ981_01425 [Gammaproteobacteria bacterium]|nr:hypothetical protein [Gammaproteobacteria bacterium]
MPTVSLLISLLFFASVSMAAAGAPVNPATSPDTDSVVSGSFSQVSELAQPMFLAGMNTEDKGKSEPESGDLVLPGEEKPEGEKKCLNICKEWGEDCFINPRTGAKKCRRTCKNFGMECF